MPCSGEHQAGSIPVQGLEQPVSQSTHSKGCMSGRLNQQRSMTTATSSPEQQASDAAAMVAHYSLSFLQRFNGLTPLHRQFIKELAGYYTANYLGSSVRRLVVTAPPGLGKTSTLRFFLQWAIKMVGWGNGAKGILVCSNQIEELENHYRWLEGALGPLDGLVAYTTRKPRETSP